MMDAAAAPEDVPEDGPVPPAISPAFEHANQPRSGKPPQRLEKATTTNGVRARTDSSGGDTGDFAAGALLALASAPQGDPNHRPSLKRDLASVTAVSSTGGNAAAPVLEPPALRQRVLYSDINSEPSAAAGTVYGKFADQLLWGYASCPTQVPVSLVDAHKAALARASQDSQVRGLHYQPDPPNLADCAVVQLSVVTCKPCYTEPWRKLAPESSSACGVVIPWGSPSDGQNGADARRDIRILTNAKLVRYATSIKALLTEARRDIDYSSSYSCTVEFMSPEMDLALLEINAEDIAVTKLFPAVLHPSPSLANVGDRVKYMSQRSNSNGYGRRDTFVPSSLYEGDCAGTSSSTTVNITGSVGCYWTENNHNLLRMQVLLPSSQDNSLPGGAVVSSVGGLVGIGAFSSSSSGLEVIPSHVICLFLSKCAPPPPPPHNPRALAYLAPTCIADGDYSTSAEKKGSESAQESKKKKPHATMPRKKDAGQIKLISGIPSIGITGVQTLESKALRNSLGLLSNSSQHEPLGSFGVRVQGINHSMHQNNDHQSFFCCAENKPCHSSLLRTDDVLLAIDDTPILRDGTVPLVGRERVGFHWLVASKPVGSQIKLDIIRKKERQFLRGRLSTPRYLVPKEDDALDHPSYLIVGGCVIVPLSRAWLSERYDYLKQTNGEMRAQGELQCFNQYLHEQKKGNQQLLLLSHVLADDVVNDGYHRMKNLILTSVNGQRPVNVQGLLDILVRKEVGSDIEFKCTDPDKNRAKIAICMSSKDIFDREARILTNYSIDASYSYNSLSPALRREAESKAHRHGVTCGLKTLRALRNAIRETTLVVNPKKNGSVHSNRHAGSGDENRKHDSSSARKIAGWSETHKMQSAPLFAGKYTEDGGWTQVKTKHLSQLCVCGKSTRFYCICSVGVMRCKDCFLKHCRDHSNHGCSVECEKDGCSGGAEILAEGVELVTTKKRKRNNPTQAVQSRCVVCKAKTCYVCSACGFDKEVALCHVSTGRSCFVVHTSEKHSTKKCLHEHEKA